MQIRNTLDVKNRKLDSRSPVSDQGKSEFLESLKRTDLVNDIFNNRKEKKDDGQNVKLRISQSTRALSNNLKKDIADFLSQNKELSIHLEKLELPGQEYNQKNKNSDFNIRKLNMYMQWLQIREGGENVEGASKEEIHSSEAPYMAIHQIGKDQEIRDIFSSNEDMRISLQENRSKSVPNYYYLVYPETYSFN
ncbi:MAG: hypothetical protein ACI9S8_000728 [Chlamydiales bacterium]|jgi:hypothetical protein